MGVLEQSREEIKWQDVLLEVVQEAILGIATVSVKDLRQQFVLKKFNPTRKVQEDLIKKISKSIENGQIRASSHPLVVAIEKDDINVEALGGSYDPVTRTPPLQIADITNPEASLFVLAGFHRLSATWKAMRSLETRLKKVQEFIQEMEAPPEESDEIEDRPTEGNNASLRRPLEEEINGIVETLNLAQIWPVWFYDYG